MKTDKISFGTKPQIGDIAASCALPKYKKVLTEGLFDAFEKLSKNGTDDVLVVNLGTKRGAKKITTDTIDISYFTKAGENLNNLKLKSSITISPKSLEKLSKKNISKFIIDSYEKLTKSDKKNNLIGGYPTRTNVKTSEKHSIKIKQLINLFGFDDWTCA